MFLFSQIFERAEDMKNNPFEFKKRVKPRQPDDKYGDGKIKMQSVLIRPRKNSSLVQ